MSKRALITGVTGQDGAYLSRLLLEKGYQVSGTFRPTSSLNLWRLRELGIEQHPNLKLIEHDLTDLAGSYGLLEQTEPDEVYNLAAQSFVGLSFKQPISTAHVTGIGTLNLLEAIRVVNPKVRFLQASSSEMFGGAGQQAQDENTPLAPRSPYAVAKCFAHLATLNYRESYGLHAVIGILFNHESPLRGEAFVTRKVAQAAARVKSGSAEVLRMGNLNAQRDWGYAPEFVDGIWRIMQAKDPETYVLATGVTYSVRDYVDACFAHAGLGLAWKGTGLELCAYDASTGRLRIAIDPALYRPTDLDRVLGNPQKARRALGWKAETVAPQLAQTMVDAELKRSTRQ